MPTLARFLFVVFLWPPALLPEDTGRRQVAKELETRTGKQLPEALPPSQSGFRLPPGLTVTERLTAADAVAIALWNNTAFHAALAALGLAQADVIDAGLLRNPSFQSLIPVGAKPFEFLLNWPIEDLWQRKKRVLAAQKSLEVITTGLVQNGLNMVRDVNVAYGDLWLAQRRLETLRESAALRSRIALLTERRQNDGDASGLDVSLTWSDARSAEELARRAEGDIDIARSRLQVMLGMRGTPQTVETIALPDVLPVPTAAPLLEIAFSSRPDLRAAELAIEAGVYRAKWQRSRVFTMVWPVLSSKESGTPMALRTGPGWNMEIPIFNRNQGQIARADAEVIQAAWRYAALRDQVEAEVRDALARREQAHASRQLLRTSLRPAVDAAIAQMEAAYRNGDASFLNVLEATRQKFDVQLRELDAEAALARAHAELERSIGKKL
ncbi:MAG: TolC family protein [Acidobacteria bacterium]|nr:TolC family protein [Acidobacteriota bacterium]